VLSFAWHSPVVIANRTAPARRLTVALIAAVLCLTAVAAIAQRRFLAETSIRNVPYDGRFTFVRVRYTTAPGGFWAGGLPSWIHGFPLAERNLMRIMRDICLLDAHTDEINVLTLDDPELFKLKPRSAQ